MQTWVGLTVAQVLASCGTPYEDVRLHDEPPGKLRTVEFVCRSQQPPARVTLELAYRDELFSTERRWPRALVEAQTVAGVQRGGGW